MCEREIGSEREGVCVRSSVRECECECVCEGENWNVATENQKVGIETIFLFRLNPNSKCINQQTIIISIQSILHNINCTNLYVTSGCFI